jgi:hypothetical protein
MRKNFSCLFAVMFGAYLACGAPPMADAENGELVHAITGCTQAQVDACAATCQNCVPFSGGACDTVTPAAAGTVCRKPALGNPATGGVSSGECDPAEVCDGATMACPVDMKTAAGTACDQLRAKGGPCDEAISARKCDSAGNCVTRWKAGMQCKAAGTSSICDPADLCDGKNILCPGKFAPPRTPCGGGLVCTINGLCR